MASFVTDKQRFCLAVATFHKSLAPLMDQAPDILQEWFDKSLGEEIQDVDVAPLGDDVTPDDITAGIVLIQNLANLFKNAAVSQAQYSQTVNAFRRVNTV